MIMEEDKDKLIATLTLQLQEKDQAIESLQEINQSLGRTCNNDAKEIERLREKLANTTVFAPKISNNAELVLQIIEYDKAGIDYLKQSQNQTAIKTIEILKGVSSKTYENASDGSEHIIAWLFTPMEVKQTLQQIAELKGE